MKANELRIGERYTWMAKGDWFKPDRPDYWTGTIREVFQWADGEWSAILDTNGIQIDINNDNIDDFVKAEKSETYTVCYLGDYESETIAVGCDRQTAKSIRRHFRPQCDTEPIYGDGTSISMISEQYCTNVVEFQDGHKAGYINRSFNIGGLVDVF